MREHLLRALSGSRAALKAGRIARGYVITHAGDRVAVVTPHTAIVSGHETVRVDFLRAGQHWRVEDALGVAFGPEPRWLDARPTVITALPETVAAPAVAAAVNASRRLREDRTLVFAHAVALDLGDTTLRFLPLQELPAPLEAPFVYAHGSDRIEGGLRLKSPNDGFACAVGVATDQALIPHAWLTALVAYAALTCVDKASQPRPAQARPTPGHTEGFSASAARAGADSGSSSTMAGSLISAEFIPRGRTRDYLSSYVVGHRRRLRANQRHSDDAMRAATAVGIRLRENETWVRPHVRGIPEDADLEFTWRPPTSITEASV